MKYRTYVVSCLALALLLGLALDAHAWGPRASQSICLMAMQVLKQDYSEVFGSDHANLEREVLRGAATGPDLLRGIEPMQDPAAVQQTVGQQIQLLRDASDFGVSEYFAYRLGVLGALTADIIVPYGFAWTPEGQMIQAQMNADLEEHLNEYSYVQRKRGRAFVMNPAAYFSKQRTFYDEDKKIIRQDYLQGRGYDGFLSNGGENYFSRATDAVIDVWYSVLTRKTPVREVSTSPEVLKWYFVREVEFFLTNLAFEKAERSYGNFASIQVEIPEAYEYLGEQYYGFGSTESIQRGIEEWRKAYDGGGAVRSRVAKRLLAHYIREGQRHLDKASQRGSDDEDLPNALRAFEMALGYDNTSQEVAGYIKTTKEMMKQRAERLALISSIISSGLTLIEQGDQAETASDPRTAISKYQQAIVILEAVDDEFEELHEQATTNISRTRNGITRVINNVLDNASAVLDEGDQALERQEFDLAKAKFNQVPTILEVIPREDVPQDTQADIQELVDMARQRVDEARVQQQRYEDARAEQERALQGR